MAGPTTRVRRFTRLEYERMASEGILRPDERVELVSGEIVVMTPQGSRHTAVLHLVANALEVGFGKGYFVRIQSPLALGDDSEPEPDVAVVAGSPDDYLEHQPTTALLVVEVADSTLAPFDQGEKLELYARTGIADYWIVNLVDGLVEVHREPRRSRGQWGYASTKRVRAKGSISPLALPEARIATASFLR